MGSLGMINMSEKQKKKKGPVVVGWQHKNALFQPVSKTEKQTGSYSMWSAVQGTPPPPHTSPLQPSSFFGCLTLIIFVPLQPARENFVTHPSTSSRSAACRHGNSEWGREMAFHFGGEAHPPPARSPLLSAPFLWPVAPLLSAKGPFISP